MVSTCSEGKLSVEFFRDLCRDLCYFTVFINVLANSEELR